MSSVACLTIAALEQKDDGFIKCVGFVAAMVRGRQKLVQVSTPDEVEVSPNLHRALGRLDARPRVSEPDCTYSAEVIERKRE